jgi:hypothetical protein
MVQANEGRNVDAKAFVDPDHPLPTDMFSDFLSRLTREVDETVHLHCLRKEVGTLQTFVEALRHMPGKSMEFFPLHVSLGGEGGPLVYVLVTLDNNKVTLYDCAGKETVSLGSVRSGFSLERVPSPPALFRSMGGEYIAALLYDRVFATHSRKKPPFLVLGGHSSPSLARVTMWRFRLYINAMQTAKPTGRSVPHAFGAETIEVQVPFKKPCPSWCGDLVPGAVGGDLGYMKAPSGREGGGDGVWATREWLSEQTVDVYGSDKQCNGCYSFTFCTEVCLVCNVTTAGLAEGEVLLCEGCNGEVHTACSGFTMPPPGDFLCVGCLCLHPNNRKERGSQREHGEYVMDVDPKASPEDTVWLNASAKREEFGLMLYINSIRDGNGDIIPGLTANVDFPTAGGCVSICVIKGCNVGNGCEFYADYTWGKGKVSKKRKGGKQERKRGAKKGGK